MPKSQMRQSNVLTKVLGRWFWSRGYAYPLYPVRLRWPQNIIIARKVWGGLIEGRILRGPFGPAAGLGPHAGL